MFILEKGTEYFVDPSPVGVFSRNSYKNIMEKKF